MMIKNDYIYNAKIINVVDGDTLDLEIDLGFYTFVRERIRLSGIDTPELTSPDKAKREAAISAKKFTETFLNKKVTLQSFKVDKYGRFLAELFLSNDPISINQKLILGAFAVPYSGGKRE